MKIMKFLPIKITQPEEFFIVWYHVRVVMVDGQGEGGTGGARVQVGRPVVRVERVERGVRRGKSAVRILRTIPTLGLDLSFFCWRSGRRPPPREKLSCCSRKIESRPLNLRKEPLSFPFQAF